MKTLNFLLSLTMVFISTLTFAQEGKEEWSTSITDIKIKVDDLEELKTIDWDDMFSGVENNSPKDSIKLQIEINELTEFKEDFEGTKIDTMSVAVEGLSGNKTELEKRLRKSTIAMIKVIEGMIEEN